jgi:hypothetical protein
MVTSPSTGRRRRSRRRSRTKVARRRLFAAVALVLFGVLSTTLILGRRQAMTTFPAGLDLASAPSAMTPPASPDIVQASLPAAAPRPVFPYSVVPGGVASVEELRTAMATDTVVAEHYKGFDIRHARVERLMAPRIAHVSYRMAGQVYWTRKALVLPAGERVITDGVRVARTRCGNQVADQPAATSPEEPSPQLLDIPLVPRLPVSAPRMIPPVLVSWSLSAGSPGNGRNPGTGTAPLGGSGSGSGGVGFGGAPSTEGAAGPGESRSSDPEGLLETLSPVLCGRQIGPCVGPGDPGDPKDPKDTLIPRTPTTPPGGPDDPHTVPNDLTPVPVPEPSSIVLLLTGAGGLLARRLKGRRRQF